MFVDGFCLSCQYRSFFKKGLNFLQLTVKRKIYELKSFFVFLVGDAANEENKEGSRWSSYVYRSSWKSFTWCSHIKRLDSRTQSRKGKQPITTCSWWLNRSHSYLMVGLGLAGNGGSFRSSHVFEVTLECLSKAFVCFKHTLSSYLTKDKFWHFSITCFHKWPQFRILRFLDLWTGYNYLSRLHI